MSIETIKEIEEIIKEIEEIRENNRREIELLEEIVMVAGTEVALEAARRFDYKTHAYSHAEYVDLLNTFLGLLLKGIEKENALNLIESGVWRNWDNFLL